MRLSLLLILVSLSMSMLPNRGFAFVGSDSYKKEVIPGKVVLKLSADEARQMEEGNVTPAWVGRAMKGQVTSMVANEARIHRLFTSAKATVENVVPDELTQKLNQYYVLNVSSASAQDTLKLISQMNLAKGKDVAEPDYRAYAAYVPNDPYFPPSKGAWTQDFPDLWGLQNISIEKAWDVTQGENVVVAVLDTGVDYNHPELQDKVIKGKNFVAGNDDPNDDFGHGTHVAGIIAAIADNKIGIAGVSPKAQILAVKVLDNNGSGTFQNIADAIKYAADQGAHVINMSLGAQLGSNTPQFLTDALAYAHNKGTVIVAAAGNSHLDVKDFSPANDVNAIAISAFDHNDKKASFSNFGSKISVAAPGGGDAAPTTVKDPFRSVLSLLSATVSPAMTGNGALIINKNYVRQAGTSMACPYAVGVVALIRSHHPDFTVEQVRQALEKGSDTVGTKGFDLESGYGRINAEKAVAVEAPLSVQFTLKIASVSSASVAVKGTVDGSNLKEWTLSYGETNNPSTWTDISSGTSAVNDDKLADWNPSGAAKGTLLLRLVATDSNGQTYEDRMQVEKTAHHALAHTLRTVDKVAKR